MIHKRINKYLVMILVCIILLNTIAIPVKADPLTLSAIWGGTVIAKQVLALVVALAGAGITIATQEQAYSLYEDLKTNNPTLLQQMISVQPQVWTGAYNELTQDLQDIKTGVVTWLTGLFGSLQIGNNSSQGTIYQKYNNIPFRLTAVGGYSAHLYVPKLDGTEYKFESTSDGSYKFYEPITVTNIGELSGFIQIVFTYTTQYNTIRTKSMNLYHSSIPDYNSNVQTESMSISISADAPALNPEWDSENDRKYPMPPLLLPKYPDIPIKEVTTPTGGKQLEYQGTIEEYLEDITNDKTWEDLDQYIKGQAPSTTLTPTGTGTLVVGGTITDGLPYPYPNTDAPTGVLEGIGSLGGLLEGITNWLSELLNAVLSIPDLLTDIFSIPEDLTLNFDSLRLSNIKNKFPFSIPWDLWKTISLFAVNPTTPDLDININTEYLQVNHEINLQPIQVPLMFARYVATAFFIIFLVTKTRDMIKW